MVAVTIATATDTFTFLDGEIKKISIVKNSVIDASSLVGLDADSTFLFDTEGVIRKITIDGQFLNLSTNRLNVGTANTLALIIAFFDGLIDGNQTATLTLNTRFLTNKLVMIEKFNWDEEAGEGNDLVRFTLALVEGTA